jgi:carboxyl-terminal processing protease
VQQVKMLPGDEGALKITNAYYYLPSGRNIHRRPDAEVWGVDPEAGFYVPMTPQQVREMIEARRNSDVLRAETQPATQPAADQPVTPQWIRQEMKDPQLAAGLEAMVGRLASGQWPQVGEADVPKQVELAQRQRLRAMLEQRVKDLQKEVARIDEGVALKEIRAALEGKSAAADSGELLLENATQPADLLPATQPGSPATQTQASESSAGDSAAAELPGAGVLPGAQPVVKP